jgi:hypothetical protein
MPQLPQTLMVVFSLVWACAELKLKNANKINENNVNDFIVLIFRL